MVTVAEWNSMIVITVGRAYILRATFEPENSPERAHSRVAWSSNKSLSHKALHRPAKEELTKGYWLVAGMSRAGNEPQLLRGFEIRMGS